MIRCMLKTRRQKGLIMKVISFCTYLVKVNDVIRLVHANDMRLKGGSPISSDLNPNILPRGESEEAKEAVPSRSVQISVASAQPPLSLAVPALPEST